MSKPDTSRRFWLLGLVMPGRWGRWLTGALIFATLLIIFVLFGQVHDATNGEGGMTFGSALFFCIIFGYIVPIHHLIIERSLTAIVQLEAQFPPGRVEPGAWRRRIVSKSRRWIVISLSLGTLAGIGHNFGLTTGDEPDRLTNFSNLLPILTTLLVWITMTSVISSLIDTALLFRQIAKQIPIDLLNTRVLTPIGSIAVSSTLAMIGAQAAFPAMMLDSDLEYVTFVPGLIATGLPMLFLFLLPIWPLHRRLSETKRAALDQVAIDLAALPRPSGDEEANRAIDRYKALEPLLTYRREVAQAAEWPFDTTVMGRLALYLIIPPLTWVGAALIEILIDSAL